VAFRPVERYEALPVKHYSRQWLAISAKITLMAAGILAGIYALGEFTVGRMLTRDAVGTAQLWSLSALENASTDIREAIEAADGKRLARALSIARIDRLGLLDKDGRVTPLHGAVSGADMERAVAAIEGGDAAGRLSSGTYRETLRVWFRSTPVRTWVVLPPDQAESSRLALRIDQSETAADLVSSFTREAFFSGGVASITFLSFMAGFSYRQRRLAAENAAIRHLALHDQLTGLPNRKQFDEFLATTLARIRRKGRKAALFVLDLDGFKAVNDTLGHPVGDGLLKATALRLKSSLRVDDLLARLAGDEFAIVVPEVKDTNTLPLLAERVLQLLSSPFKIDGHEINIGCSIGLAVGPDNGSDGDSLMRSADFALYRAKSEGRRTWRFFDPKMAEDLATRRTLEDGLRLALENEHFELLYQPQIELATGRTTGYEAMLRWRLPGRGLVPASVFVSVAEETGLVVPIGEWVIQQVARDCAYLPADCSVAVNFSATQLKRDGMDRFILDTLRSHQVPPGRMEIEVNETVLGRNEADVFSRLNMLRKAGIHIVMDSFGVGTLSLGLLSRCSFNKIKVDRSFLLNDEQKGGAVLAAICNLGQSLGFRVAGQGVESRAHEQLLRSAGCSEAQGYYYAPPIPLDQVVRHARERAEPQLAAIA
jgi:diguanylate cyclase (GGDEF)-like protein